LQAHDGEPAKGKQRGRARNAPKFDLRTQLFKICGVDLTRIDGIDVTTALAVCHLDAYTTQTGLVSQRTTDEQALSLDRIAMV